MKRRLGLRMAGYILARQGVDRYKATLLYCHLSDNKRGTHENRTAIGWLTITLH